MLPGLILVLKKDQCRPAHLAVRAANQEVVPSSAAQANSSVLISIYYGRQGLTMKPLAGLELTT